MLDVNLSTLVSDLFMIGDKYAKKLVKLEIHTVEDLLNHYPHRFEDYSNLKKISEIKTGETANVVGVVTNFKNIYTKYGKKIQTGTITDQTGQLNFIFFNQPFLQSVFKPGKQISLAGAIQQDQTGRLQMQNPQYEDIKPNRPLIHTGRLVPIYHETAGVSSKWLRSRIFPLIKTEIYQEDYLPEMLTKKYQLAHISDAIKNIHFPENEKNYREARKRLEFDEAFIIQLKAKLKRLDWQNTKKADKLKNFSRELDEFISSFPFTLTDDQQKVSEEIIKDLAKTTPANRLIQGDVGSGKTVLAVMAAYLAALNSKKTMVMCPTEILARQHYKTFGKLFEKTKVKIGLLTSESKVHVDSSDILIGTHALLFGKRLFKPSLVIIDEQHRFGVEQRSKLLSLEPRPHLITMTATPIPRTLSLALYNDLDVSTIKQMPLGEKIIKTWVVGQNKRKAAYKWVSKQINENNSQAFIICPLIEESEHESMKDIKAVTKEYEKLKKVFKDLKLALIHGKMSASKKQEIMKDFHSNKYHILVSTPVIEVGIDIPNASVIIIEGAERFGLAQLHQMRGRVGRISQQAYCLLFTSKESSQNTQRLKAMEKTLSGFELAEIDLKIRGPGEIFGTDQSGYNQLKLADITNKQLFACAGESADKISKKIDEFPLLRQKIKGLKISSVAAN